MPNFHNDHRQRARREARWARIDAVLDALTPTEDDNGDALRPHGVGYLPSDAARSTRDARTATVNRNPRTARP